MQKLKYDADSGLVFALAHVNQTDGPQFPLAELARVSRDYGQTWEPFTEVRDVVSATIGDIDVLDDRYVLSNVDFALADAASSASAAIMRLFPTSSSTTSLV